MNPEPLLICGDVRRVLKKLARKSIHCAVTSPPYWNLRDYGGQPVLWSDGWKGCLGLEPTPQLYVQHLVEIFREMREVLRDDATFWLNIGDTYAANRSYQCPSTKGGAKHSPAQGFQQSKMTIPNGLKPKDLVGIPWMLAFALREDGWYLRQEIIWAKLNPMPESCTDRCVKSHEQLFLLTKRPDYYFDSEALKEPIANPNDRRTGKGGKWKEQGLVAQQYGLERVTGNQAKGRLNSFGGEMRNKRGVWGMTLEELVEWHAQESRLDDLWRIGTKPFKEAHFACFPPALIEPCIKAGTSEKGCCSACGAPYTRVVVKERIATRPAVESKTYGVAAEVFGNRDPERHVCISKTKGWLPSCGCRAGAPVPCTVLDPFTGSGTANQVSSFLGRNSIGIDTKQEYIEIAKRRVLQPYKSR